MLQAHHFAGISAQGLSVWRGERPVLRGLSLAVGAGEFVHVAGPNGAGKTTLLRVLAGLLPPEEGRVEWRGAPIDADREAWAREIGYLGHADGLKGELTAAENLRFGAGLRVALEEGAIDAALAQTGLAGCRALPARVLSAGQRRRLALAGLLLSGASLWILDEPFTNLDAGGSGALAALIGLHLDAGGAAIVAAHQLPAIPGRAARRVELS